MSRAIEGLLRRAALEHRQAGAVCADTALLLAAEGYDLAALDADIDAQPDD